MEHRICPKCNKPAYSSVFGECWECPNCNEEVVEMSDCISGEEYEANVDEEDEDE